MSHHIIEVKDLDYTYPDGVQALEGVSFRITHGETVGLIGANGAGKSTLLLHLNGCLMSRNGAVNIGGISLSSKTINWIRRAVGLIFQDPDDQLFMPTVYEDVAFGPRNLGLPPEEVEKRVSEALETVGSIHLKDRPPYKLSGGEKRAVAIAAVLSMSPDILLLDEPSAGLDPRTRRRLIELLRSFLHTKIIATHDLDLVLDLCQRTIIINKGKIAADGPTLEIFNNEALLEQNNLEQPLRLKGY